MIRSVPCNDRETAAMTPDPDRKPTKSEMRVGGMVATAVLVALAVFTVVFVIMAA